MGHSSFPLVKSLWIKFILSDKIGRDITAFNFCCKSVTARTSSKNCNKGKVTVLHPDKIGRRQGEATEACFLHVARKRRGSRLPRLPGGEQLRKSWVQGHCFLFTFFLLLLGCGEKVTVNDIVENPKVLSPFVTITLADDITVGNEANYTVSGTCVVGAGSIVLTVSSGRRVLTTSGKMRCTGTGQWIYPPRDVSRFLYPMGKLVLKATQTNAVGKEHSATKTITKETSPATVTVLTIAISDDITSTNQSHYSVSGRCTTGVGNVNVSVGGVTGSSACSSSGTWSVAGLDVSGLNDGRVRITATQNGRSVNKSVNKRATLATATVLTITIPDEITSMNQSRYSVSGTCTTGAGNVSVSVGGVTGSSACTSSGTWSVTGLDVSGLNDGRVRITATQNGRSVNRNVNKNAMPATATVLTITMPDEITFTNQSHYSVSGTCTAGNSNVSVSVEGVTGSSACSSSGTWDVTGLDLSSLDDGSVFINVNQTDNAGIKINLVASTNKRVGSDAVIFSPEYIQNHGNIVNTKTDTDPLSGFSMTTNTYASGKKEQILVQEFFEGQQGIDYNDDGDQYDYIKTTELSIDKFMYRKRIQIIQDNQIFEINPPVNPPILNDFDNRVTNATRRIEMPGNIPNFLRFSGAIEDVRVHFGIKSAERKEYYVRLEKTDPSIQFIIQEITDEPANNFFGITELNLDGFNSKPWINHSASVTYAIYAIKGNIYQKPLSQHQNFYVRYDAINTLNPIFLKRAFDKTKDILTRADASVPGVLNYFNNVRINYNLYSSSSSYYNSQIGLGSSHKYDSRPLIHEVAHGYHEHLLPGGFDNADIKAMYERLPKDISTTYGDEQNSYWRVNFAEFFAEVLTTYIYLEIAEDVDFAISQVDSTFYNNVVKPYFDNLFSSRDDVGKVSPKMSLRP
ncbi:MAG: hypothetical protein OXB88_09735 [Bacteriovoracales bacterium]|nr:hypothetical protein [Bacteriovoracales bacterium]